MIIASTPIFSGGVGSADFRIVLKSEDEKYIVHTQFFYSDGTNAFGDGSYFPWFNYDDEQETFREAYAEWLLRCTEAGAYLLSKRNSVAQKGQS